MFLKADASCFYQPSHRAAASSPNDTHLREQLDILIQYISVCCPSLEGKLDTTLIFPPHYEQARD